MLTVWDLMLSAAALVILFRGFHGRWGWFRRAKEDRPPANWKRLFGELISHRRILRRKSPGLAHLALFWGVVFMVAVVAVSQFKPSLPVGAARALSLASDAVGTAMLAGLGFFVVRRLRESPHEGPRKALPPLIVLGVVIVTGFLAEGVRLSILPQEAAWASPVGWLLSLGLPDSPLFMQLMIRVHFFGFLVLVAMVPYTAFRHVAEAALNVSRAASREKGKMRPLSLEQGDLGAGRITDLTWDQCLDEEACVSCGRCEEQCPAFLTGKPLSPKRLVQGILSQAESVHGPDPDPAAVPELRDAVPDDALWACTGCLACAVHCPVSVDPLEKILDMRRYRTLERGDLPKKALPVLQDLRLYGDVSGRGPALRNEWALGLDVPVVSDITDPPGLLLWVGCSGAYHPHYAETARSLVRILRQADVAFGTLGKSELCCGDPARRLGEESLFLDLAEKNIATLEAAGAKTVVPLCPHCYHTLRHDYRELGGEFSVVHAVELVLGLLRERKISLKYPIEHKIAFHDPCYLGRANGQYEAPRELIKAMPGAELHELPRSRDEAFCCGGGNAGMWLHESSGERINVARAREAAERDLSLLCTACPYCLTMLQDGMGALEMERRPRVVDIIQLTAECLAVDQPGAK